MFVTFTLRLLFLFSDSSLLYKYSSSFHSCSLAFLCRVSCFCVALKTIYTVLLFWLPGLLELPDTVNWPQGLISIFSTFLAPTKMYLYVSVSLCVRNGQVLKVGIEGLVRFLTLDSFFLWIVTEVFLDFLVWSVQTLETNTDIEMGQFRAMFTLHAEVAQIWSSFSHRCVNRSHFFISDMGHLHPRLDLYRSHQSLSMWLSHSLTSLRKHIKPVVIIQWLSVFVDFCVCISVKSTYLCQFSIAHIGAGYISLTSMIVNNK